MSEIFTNSDHAQLLSGMQAGELLANLALDGEVLGKSMVVESGPWMLSKPAGNLADGFTEINLKSKDYIEGFGYALVNTATQILMEKLCTEDRHVASGVLIAGLEGCRLNYYDQSIKARERRVATLALKNLVNTTLVTK